MPFVPLHDVEMVFDQLNISIEGNTGLENLYNYVEDNYIRGRATRRRSSTPAYKPELWNVYFLVKNKMHRTNNVAEGWHSKFQRIINVHHASIWRFLENIQKDQRDNEILILQLKGGHQKIRHPIKKSYLLNMTQIESVVDRYEQFKAENDIKHYLRLIGFRLKKDFEQEEE